MVGSGHSPSDIVCVGNDDILVSLDRMNELLMVDYEYFQVRVEAGIKLKDLHVKLSSLSMAMSNLGSISEQSLAGAISTGTHGTGARFGIMATQVTALTLITSNGLILSLDKSDKLFYHALCSLGMLGVIVDVTLQLEPLYNLKVQHHTMKFSDMTTKWEEQVKSGEHVRFWWFPYTEDVVMWSANRTDEPLTPANKRWVKDQFYGRRLLETLLYFSGSKSQWINKVYFNYQFGQRQLEDQVLNSVEAFNFDCLFQQCVAEWALNYAVAPYALQELKRKLEQMQCPAHFPIEIRFVKGGDNISLSPSFGGDIICYIGVIIYRPFGQDVCDKEPLWQAFEGIMKKFQGKPHWAKQHDLSPQDLQRLYPQYDAFGQARQQLDPYNLLVNDYVQRHFKIQEKVKL